MFPAEYDPVESIFITHRLPPHAPFLYHHNTTKKKNKWALLLSIAINWLMKAFIEYL